MKKYSLLIAVLIQALCLAGYFIWKKYYPLVETYHVLIPILILLTGSMVMLVLWIKLNTSQRVFAHGANAVIMVIAVLGILIAVNFISDRRSFRNDLTQNKRFSISDQSIKVIKELKTPVKIIGFYQEGDMGSRNQLKDLAEEYSHYNTKITYEFVDPLKNLTKAKEYGIRQANVAVVEIGPEKKEKIQDKFTEQTLTNAILKLTKSTNKIVYFLKGHKEAELDKDLAKVKDALIKETYEVKDLLLLQAAKVPDDCTVLIIAGPEKDPEKVEIDKINEYLNRGGKVMVMVDPMKTGLNTILNPWKVNAGDDVVIDLSGIGQVFGSGIGMPIGTDYPEHAITKDMKNIATGYPMSRSINLITEGDPSIIATTIVQSLPQCYAYKGKIEGSTEPKIDEKRDKPGPISMAVAISKPLPQQEEPVTNPLAPPEKKKEKEIRMVVVGTSRFIYNDFLDFQGNRDMFLNMTNWLSEQEDLISIRPKPPEIHQLDLKPEHSLLIFLSTLIVLPLAMIIFGVSVWLHRR